MITKGNIEKKISQIPPHKKKKIYIYKKYLHN